MKSGLIFFVAWKKVATNIFLIPFKGGFSNSTGSQIKKRKRVGKVIFCSFDFGEWMAIGWAKGV